MSKPVVVEWLEGAEVLRERFAAERDVGRRKRLQALWLVRRGWGVAASAEQAGVGERTLERWLGWYREGGLDGVLGRVPGRGARGAPARLDEGQLGRLAERAGGGGVRTYGGAAEWVRSEYGVGYSYNGMWSLLARLEIRPKVPRPAAEKADPAAQEAYKKGGSPRR